jgi:hypothetical protein
LIFRNILKKGLQIGYKKFEGLGMAKVKLTAGRISAFQCDKDKKQSFLWCSEVSGLGVRATAGSNEKRYIFQTKIKGKSMRLTIGKVNAWSISEAQAEARRLQVSIDKGNDPRDVKEIEDAEQNQLSVNRTGLIHITMTMFAQCMPGV